MSFSRTVLRIGGVTSLAIEAFGRVAVAAQGRGCTEVVHHTSARRVARVTGRVLWGTVKVAGRVLWWTGKTGYKLGKRAAESRARGQKAEERPPPRG